LHRCLTACVSVCSEVKEKKRKEQEEKKKNAPKGGAKPQAQGSKVKASGGPAMKPTRSSAPGKAAAR
jgi:hypothetical protein